MELISSVTEPEILVALLAMTGSVIGTLGGILLNTRLVNYRLGELERKMDQHNQVIDRVYRLEEQDAVLREKLKEITRRMNESGCDD